jgi:hypothetical protein
LRQPRFGPCSGEGECLLKNKGPCNVRGPLVTEHLPTTFKQENLMPIKVFIKRHIKEGREEEGIAMLYQFRRMAGTTQRSASNR